MDAQLEFKDEYAYVQDEFPKFYDLMVDALPPEFEVGIDSEFYFGLFKGLENPVVLDLFSGTGRVIENVLQNGCKDTRFIAVDHSASMLKVSTSKLCDKLGTNSVEFLCQSVSELNIDGKIPNVVIVSAGSFHHCATKDEQIQVLQSIARCMDENSVLALSFLTKEQVLGEEELEDMKLGEFERKQTNRTVETVVEEIGSHGSFTSQIATFTFEFKSRNGIQNQSWSLRTISGLQEIEALLDVAGLKLIQTFNSFSDGIKGIEQDSQDTSNDVPVVILAKKVHS